MKENAFIHDDLPDSGLNNDRGDAFPLLIAEIVLVFHALTYSTPLFRVAAAITAGAGLLLAARAGARRETLPIFLPLLVGGLVSLQSGAAPGPTIEVLGILLGAWGWFLTGALRAPRSSEGRRVPPGAIFAATGIVLAEIGRASWRERV